MNASSTGIRTLIGLPIFLAVALGLAFGASYLSRTLRQDPTLHANTNTNTPIEGANTSAASSDRSSEAITVLAATIYQRMAQSAILTNSAANQTSATNAATIVLSGVCWLSMNPNDLQFFPVGYITDEFTELIRRYASPADPRPVCSSVTEAAQTQASRFMTLDDDGDGLNTIAEYWYDTNQFSNDTDQDGFRDGEEIANGFNPRGAGPTSSSSQ